MGNKYGRVVFTLLLIVVIVISILLIRAYHKCSYIQNLSNKAFLSAFADFVSYMNVADDLRTVTEKDIDVVSNKGKVMIALFPLATYSQSDTISQVVIGLYNYWCVKRPFENKITEDVKYRLMDWVTEPEENDAEEILVLLSRLGI